MLVLTEAFSSTSWSWSLIKSSKTSRDSLHWKQHTFKKIIIPPHHFSSHDPNKPLYFLWSPAGYKNNPSDPPHWSQKWLGEQGWIFAHCWLQRASWGSVLEAAGIPLVNTHFDLPLAHFSEDLRENNAPTAQQPSVLRQCSHIQIE